MGNKAGNAKLKKEELKVLTGKKAELTRYYKQFMEEVPSGQISEKEFGQLTELMGLKDKTVTGIIFNAFDRNADGAIEFSEFITTLTVMTRGDAEEKLKFAFRLYDQDKDGFISKEEMLLVVSGLYKMLGDLATLQGNDYDSPEKLVARLFLEMDKERKGAICFEQFRAFALKDQSIIMSLGLGI